MKTLRFLVLACAFWGAANAAGVKVRFDPASPEVGPYPSDFLTSADMAQITGKRVQLPLPDCEGQPDSCRELDLINQLDGFNLSPRVHVRFSAPVDPDSFKDGIILVALDNLFADEPGRHNNGDIVAINQIIYDPDTNTVYAKSDAVLDQHRSYALVVTDAVKDAGGDPVEAENAYSNCIADPQDGYCAALAQALTVLPDLGGRSVVGASVFTTLSATAWMRNARALVQNWPLNLQRTGTKSIFRVADLDSFTWNQQIGPGTFRDFSLPLNNPLLSGIGQVAFGSYRSPRFLNDSQIIDPAPTAAELPAPPGDAEIFFHALLPSTAKPAAGYPVVIFGHGFGDSRFGGPSAMAGTLAQTGFATVAINAVGHGFGPDGTVTIKEKNGSTTVLPAGGRGIDLNGDGSIDATEGCMILSPSPVGLRDCFRQTVVDLMQLVRAIRTGVDLDGDGLNDLDPDRIYYGGESLGSLYGTMLAAMEPDVRAAALNVGGGSVVDIARWSPAYRPWAGDFLASRVPPLVNPGDPFDENYVLRNQPVKVNDQPGAIDIQNYFELLEWLQAAGDPLSYAPQLSPKPVLWQFAKGDRTVPNPTTSALIRAAGMQSSTSYYRHDLARARYSSLPEDPHSYLLFFLSVDTGDINVNLFGVPIGQAAQEQIAGFFAADGSSIPDPNNNTLVRSLYGNIFEVPADLPEDFNW
ncbi:MAG: hypothetical protein M1541_11185 [Acidobacteria bacterium]|nr:hypothetical protein [Acidobacteriota bacterium]